MMADGETTWVPFLVRGLDPKILARIRRDAARRKLAVQDFMRLLLCRHYSLDCESSGATARASKGSTTIYLRLHPHLKMEIELEAQERGLSQQLVVHEILGRSYTRKRAA
jgi:hypothetical protein